MSRFLTDSMLPATKREQLTLLPELLVDGIMAKRTPGTVNLRAEEGGNGWVYTLTMQCTDLSRNSASKTVTVIVPHPGGKQQPKK